MKFNEQKRSDAIPIKVNTVLSAELIISFPVTTALDTDAVVDSDVIIVSVETSDVIDVDGSLVSDPVVYDPVVETSD